MKEKEIYLAGGCFWGTEHYFKQIEGVVETEVGFANGHTENPTYKEVYTDTTGYAETVRVRYNPDVVSLSSLAGGLQGHTRICPQDRRDHQDPSPCSQRYRGSWLHH